MPPLLSPDWITAVATAVAAVGTVVAVAAAVLLGAVITPRQADRAARRAEDRLRRREEEAEDRTFRSACLIVRDELRANLDELTRLEGRREAVGVNPPRLASDAYSQHLLLLARHLSQDSRDSLRAAYQRLRRPEAFLRVLGAPQLGMPEVAQPQYDALRDAIKVAGRGCMVLEEEVKKLPGAYRDL